MTGTTETSIQLRQRGLVLVGVGTTAEVIGLLLCPLAIFLRGKDDPSYGDWGLIAGAFGFIGTVAVVVSVCSIALTVIRHKRPTGTADLAGAVATGASLLAALMSTGMIGVIFLAIGAAVNYVGGKQLEAASQR
ncbi:hypothetical protein [Tsukamurella sp. NPDC003166]|uniref:hypothetical protein n=1 Tax=Tsukamurella sp. NPDC003166 TaxID=3154444 RepID=UPI0033B2C448